MTGVLPLRRAERRGAILTSRNGSSDCDFRRQNGQVSIKSQRSSLSRMQKQSIEVDMIKMIEGKRDEEEER